MINNLTLQTRSLFGLWFEAIKRGRDEVVKGQKRNSLEVFTLDVVLLIKVNFRLFTVSAIAQKFLWFSNTHHWWTLNKLFSPSRHKHDPMILNFYTVQLSKCQIFGNKSRRTSTFTLPSHVDLCVLAWTKDMKTLSTASELFIMKSRYLLTRNNAA